MLGDQDLKKTESHEQTFRVEKILKYSRYNEKDDIPHNDIGKYPLSLLWASPLVEIWGLVTESSHDPSYPFWNPVSCIIYFPAFYVYDSIVDNGKTFQLKARGVENIVL